LAAPLRDHGRPCVARACTTGAARAHLRAPPQGCDHCDKVPCRRPDSRGADRAQLSGGGDDGSAGARLVPFQLAETTNGSLVEVHHRTQKASRDWGGIVGTALAATTAPYQAPRRRITTGTVRAMLRS